MADVRPVRRRGAAADMPGIRPVSLPRVSDEVAEQIRRLIVTEQLAEHAISLPMFPGISEAQLETVVEALADYFRG